VYLIALFKVVVVPVAIAILLATLLTPAVRFLSRWLRFPRPLSSVVAVLGLVAFVVLLVTLAGRSIFQGFADLRDQAIAGFGTFLDWLAEGPLGLDSDTLTEYLQNATSAVEDNAGSLVTGALTVTTTVGQVLAGAIITLFCTFFFLLDGRRIWGWVVGLVPRRNRETVHQAGRRGLVTLAAYTRTQILVAFVDGAGIGIGAAILQLPWAFPLGVLVFVGSFIPFVGAIVTGAIAVLVALVVKGWVAALIMLGIVLLVQQIEGNVLQPFLMGHAVSLHPVAVLLVVTAGTLIAGILGALFAVPIAAVINTVVLFWHGHDKFPDLGYDDHVRLREPGENVRERVQRALVRVDTDEQDTAESR
ncbi:MAG: AI-2E family transporter, partial [Cellulomonadaceae bacterium]